MASSPSSTVVPFGDSMPSAARRYGCSQQMLLELVLAGEVPGYTKDGQVRIPRGFDTGFDCHYDTNFAWVDARQA